MRIVRILVLASLPILPAVPVFAQVGVPAPADAATPLTLEQLERMALQNNPTVRQAEAAVAAARGRARQAGAWPNPTIGYVAEEVSFGPIIRGGEHGLFATQMIPLGGKLRLGRAVFDREAEQAQSLAGLQQQRILSAVRTQYYEVLTIERRVEVLDRLAQLSAEAVGVTRQLFNVGAADRPDVLESEIEARRAQLDLTAARNGRFAAWRRLAATVGDLTLTPRPLATSIEAAVPELDRETALRQIVDRSPEVLAARADIERNRAIVSRARKETFPDLFLRGGLAYNRELLETSGAGPPQPVGREGSFEVGVSVPLFNRNQGGVAAARAEQSRAEAEVLRLELSIESRLATLFDAYLTSLRSAEAYRDEMLPRAEEAYRLYLARYREAAAAYPQVLIAQRTLFELNAKYLEDLEAAWRSALRIQGFLVEDDGLAPPLRPGELEAGTGGGSRLQGSMAR